MSLIYRNFFIKKINFCYPNNSLKKSLIVTSSRFLHSRPNTKLINAEKEDSQSEDFQDIISYSKDSRIRYNCILRSYKPNLPHYMIKQYQYKIDSIKKQQGYKRSIPLVVEKLTNSNITRTDANEAESIKENSSNLSSNKNEQFPFSKFENVKISNTQKEEESINIQSFSMKDYSVKDDVAERLKIYNEKKLCTKIFSQMAKQDSELEFKLYKDSLLTELPSEQEEENVSIYIGTTNPNIPKSNVPCGGCGIHLHCQDEGLPGYVPSEEFCHKEKFELRSTLCQRCFFLNRHNTALNIRISPEIYEKALQPIRESRALAIVVVDLLDVPCSIWPGLFELIGSKRPVVVVGNKVDLIPLDNVDYMNTIKNSMVQSIKDTNLWSANICHACVVSAKTGFGVEDLITHLMIKWGNKGDMYILGCTNAGKSTLFNALLGSDLCKVAANNLIMRATSSPWPGTTLNLLKFPVVRPSGKRLNDRMKRIAKEQEKKEKEIVHGSFATKFNSENTPTLIGHIGKTFEDNPLKHEDDLFDSFFVNAHKKPRDFQRAMGINEKHKDFKDGVWCYDTPGTVQPDQFIGLLTHDELMEVLPRTPIVPRSFSLHNSQSIFIGGLVRLDLLYTPLSHIRITVCCSPRLPITIVDTADASSVYRSYLGTEIFHVPCGSKERFKKWPCLKPTNVKLKGIGERSAADVVLSSAGFISIATRADDDIDLRAWTPSGRGVYVRSSSMLPFACNLIGKKRSKTSMYHNKEASSVKQ